MEAEGEPVLLGLVDQPVKTSDKLDLTVSKIGGHPVGLHDYVPPECPLCHRQILLVVQVYCPLGGSPYHRTLYLFACINPACWNDSRSWIVLRHQILEEANTRQSASTSDDWGVDADSWGDAKDDSTTKEAGAMATTDWCEGADDWGGEEHPAFAEEMAGQDTTVSGSVSTPPSEWTKLESLSSLKCDTDDKNVKVTDEPVATEPAEIEGQMKTMFIDDAEEGSPDSDTHPSSACIPEDDLTVQLTKLKENMDIPKTEKENLTLVGDDASFTAYYLNVIEESHFSCSKLNHEKTLLAEYATRDNINIEALIQAHDKSDKGGKQARSMKKGSAGGEGYEKGLAKHGDATFHRFHKRISMCPQQVIRYSYNGKPLPLVDQGQQACTPCEACGAARLFELQLMPALVSQLAVPDVNGPLLEFGTVMVYTCSQSCWQESGGCRRELAVLQADPDNHLFS